MGKLMQLMHKSRRSKGMQSKEEETNKVTLEEVENAHHDINQWRATWDWGSTAPPDYKASWLTPASNLMKGKQGRLDKVCACLYFYWFFSVPLSIFKVSITAYLGHDKST